MICTKCDESIADESKFCSSCGKEIIMKRGEDASSPLDHTFEKLAAALKVTPEVLVGLIGADWNSTHAKPNLLIRGGGLEYVVFDEDEDDEDDDSYPDVGIFLDSPNRIEIGNVEAIYDPGPAGFEIKTLLTLDPKDPLVLEKLEAAIEYAARVRKAEMQVCMYCKEKLPSYSMSEDGYCYGCGSSELGIIY